MRIGTVVSWVLRLGLLLALFPGPRGSAAEPLAAMDADLSATSVSGISAGGYMAVQFHIAHSSIVVGAGILAAGPYYCAQGNAGAAYYNCREPGPWTPLPPLTLLKSQTEALAVAGRIDPLAGLKRARVWLFSGTRDRTVSLEVVEALAQYYRSYLAAGAVAYVHDVPAGHGMVTTDFGTACGATEAPFLNECQYDAAGQLLNHLLGPLQPPAERPGGRIIAFAQDEFATGGAHALSLSNTGYVYVPAACAKARCRVHVAFHGCHQSAEEIDLEFVRHAGYNRWADTNRLIVLYPQTTAREGVAGMPPDYIFNPYGCWDWWGYTGPAYHTKDGPQIRFVMSMLNRLAQPR